MVSKIGSQARAIYRPAVSMPAIIRQLVPDDADAIRGVILTAFQGLLARLDPPPSALGETTRSLAAQIAATGGLAAEARAGPVACMLWREDGRGLYLSRLAVLPQCRRTGLARRLLAAAETEARARGLACLRLSTRLALADNRALFAACGFVETTRHAHPGYDHSTFVDLERTL